MREDAYSTVTRLACGKKDVTVTISTASVEFHLFILYSHIIPGKKSTGTKYLYDATTTFLSFRHLIYYLRHLLPSSPPPTHFAAR